MSHKAHLTDLMRKHWVTPLDALTLCDCLSFSQRLTEIKRQLIGTDLVLVDRWIVTDTGKRIKAWKIKGVTK
jgi:hypothetical protein